MKDTLAAVRGIHGQDYIFSAASLSKLTGITRQTLSLPAYRVLWDNNYLSDNTADEANLNHKSSETNNKLLSKINQLETELTRSEELKQNYFKENKLLRKQYSELLFMNLSILRRMRLYGISSEDLVNELQKIQIRHQ